MRRLRMKPTYDDDHEKRYLSLLRSHPADSSSEFVCFNCLRVVGVVESMNGAIATGPLEIKTVKTAEENDGIPVVRHQSFDHYCCAACLPEVGKMIKSEMKKVQVEEARKQKESEDKYGKLSEKPKIRIRKDLKSVTDSGMSTDKKPEPESEGIEW